MMAFDESGDGMQGFYNKKLNSSMKFFSQGGYVSTTAPKKTASNWLCKQCGHLTPVSRKGSKLDTNPPPNCEMCNHTTFALQISSTD